MKRIIPILLIACIMIFWSDLFAQQIYSPERILVLFDSQTNTEKQEVRNKVCKGHIETIPGFNLELWSFSPNIEIEGKCFVEIEDYISFLQKRYPDLYVQPDYAYSLLTTPNDPNYDLQWALKSQGNNSCPNGIDLGIEAVPVSTRFAPNIKVGIVDTGIDWTHPDLVHNIWQNLGEDFDGDGKVLEWNGNRWIFDPGDENGMDDDGNGYVDDFIGWNFAYNNNNPDDDAGHGTHVAGIIGAEGNNGIGISGIAWEIQLMGLKFMDSTGTGYTSTAIKALKYAKDMGAPISNNSWGGAPRDQLLSLAIEEAGLEGHLFVAAAGNNDRNSNDLLPVYPASYDLDNIISVGAHDCKADISLYSNIGPKSVDLFAPGGGQLNAIYSTIPRGYGYKNGTSMAAPHVTGVAALLKEKIPNYGYRKLKERILSTVIGEGSMTGKCLTNGRLHAAGALLKESEKANGQQSITQSGAKSIVSDVVETNDYLFFAIRHAGILVVNKANGSTKLYNSSNSKLEFANMVAIEKTNQEEVFTGYSRFGDQLMGFEEGEWSGLGFYTQNVSSIASQGDSIFWIGANGQLIKTDSNFQKLESFDTLAFPDVPVGISGTIQPISDSIILLNVASQGLGVFNSKKGQVDTIFSVINPQLGLPSSIIFDIYQASNGRVFIGSINFGVFHALYEYANDSIIVHSIPDSINISHYHNSISGDRVGNIYMTDRFVGLYKFNLDSSFSMVSLPPNEEIRIDFVYVDSTERLWIFNSGKLFYSDDQQTWNTVPLNNTHLLYGDIRDLEIAGDNTLWVTGTEGIYCLDINSMQLQSKTWFPIQDREVLSIALGDSGSIWVSNSSKNSIIRILGDTVQQSWQYPSFSNGGTWAQNELRLIDDSLLISTSQGSLDILNLQTSNWSSIGSINWQGEVIDIIELTDISVVDSFIYLSGRIDTSDITVLRFINTSTGIQLDTIFISPSPLAITGIATDSNGVVWLAGSDQIQFIKNDSVQLLPINTYLFGNGGQSDRANYRAVTIDRNGMPWFGTSHGHIVKVISDTSILVWDSENVGIPKQNIESWIQHMKFDHNNHLWIDIGNSLYKFIPDAAASFTITKSTLCIGEVLTFINQTKRADSFIWAINDSIVSRDSNYTQNFWEAGEFKVTLTAIDSVLGDRSFTRFITVKAPIQVDLGADTVLCSPVILLKAPQDGESYFWSNLRGDTISTRRIITSDTSGTYILKAIDACGAVAADTISVTFTGRDCIWPGDVNRDGFVNLIDFLHLGLAHGEIGPSRDSLGIVWKGYEGLAWQDSSGGIDHKFYDCDGNGLVDIQTDFFAIRENYNHPIASFPVHNADAYFYFRPVNRTFNFGDTILFDFFLGSQGAPLTDVYGVSWSLKLNIFPSQEPVYDKSGSEMGNSSQVKAAIALRDRASRRLEMAITLLDGTGFNPLGDFKLMSAGPIVIIDDIEDPFALGRNRFLTVSVEEVVLFDKEGNSIPVAALSSQATHTLQLAVPQTQLDLSAWLEGASDSDSMRTDLQEQGILSPIPPLAAFENYSKDSLPDGAVDWIIVELLREQDMTIAYTKALLLMSDGSMYDPIAKDTLAHFLAVEGNYYLRIQHRNHLDVISSEALHLSEQVSTYDFSEASSRAMGFEPMKLLANGKYALMAGDGNGDNGIYISDKREVWKVQFGLRGYKAADFNLDGIVDDRDLFDFYRKNLLKTAK